MAGAKDAIGGFQNLTDRQKVGSANGTLLGFHFIFSLPVFGMMMSTEPNVFFWCSSPHVWLRLSTSLKFYYFHTHAHARAHTLMQKPYYSYSSRSCILGESLNIYQ